MECKYFCHIFASIFATIFFFTTLWILSGKSLVQQNNFWKDGCIIWGTVQIFLLRIVYSFLSPVLPRSPLFCPMLKRFGRKIFYGLSCSIDWKNQEKNFGQKIAKTHTHTHTHSLSLSLSLSQQLYINTLYPRRVTLKGSYSQNLFYCLSWRVLNRFVKIKNVPHFLTCPTQLLAFFIHA